jgi:hypothetical protein
MILHLDPSESFDPEVDVEVALPVGGRDRPHPNGHNARVLAMTWRYCSDLFQALFEVFSHSTPFTRT